MLIKNKQPLKQTEKLKYLMVSIGTMNNQINLRLSEKMIESAKSYSEKHGFSNIQEFIRETLREKLFDKISKEELKLVLKLAEKSGKEGLYGTEKQLFKKLK